MTGVNAGRQFRRHATDDEIIEALNANSGILTLACTWLLRNKNVKITRQTIYRRMKRSKKVADARREIDEKTLDIAEGKMLELLAAGDRQTILFYLRCKGKNRGYTERQELVGADGGPVAESRVIVLELPDNGRD